MTVYYNEIDPFAAQWLRNLIAAGHLPAGDVDERSIIDVQPGDLAGYAQCHFFAGIGGWPYALRLAGWPDDEPVWTGSCPCQPFSVAGKGAGTTDERHLWPAFRDLIAECRPPVVFGEQVASAAGRLWLAGVRADLEEMGYGVGAADLCAAGVGAPHIRQRLYWVADAGQLSTGRAARPGEAQGGRPFGDVAGCGGNTQGEGHQRERRGDAAGRSGPAGGLGDAGLGEWADFDFLACGDGKSRRVPLEPEFFPLAHGTTARVGRLRAYGNAIVPPLAAEFVKAYMHAQATGIKTRSNVT